jgi:ABC-type branched-subunit amino acid transport system substrate-binding protein
VIAKEFRVVTRTSRWKVVAAATSCAVLAACGSQVPPKDFVNAAGGGVGGNGQALTGGTGGTGVPVPGAGGTLAPGGGTGGGTGGSGGGTGGSGGSGGGTGGSGGGTGGGTGGGSGGSGGGTGGTATHGIKPGSCAGFKNGPGITNSTITIANVADLSGPVPGLFKSAQLAVTAYAAYFNSTSSICGRKLKVEGLDSATSESGDQQASSTACSSAFAMVGSMGAFDAGGADTVMQCGIPDLRAASTETARQRSSVSFGAYSLNTSEIPTAPFSYFKSLGDAYKHAAFVYLDAGASSLNARSFIAGEEKQGFKFIYKQAINVSGGLIPYDSYAQKMADAGVKYVQYIGAAAPYAQQLKAAIDNKSKSDSGFKPIFVMDPTAYDTHYTSAGSSVNGTYVFNAGPLFEEANRNPQLAAYLQWLQRTSGGAPTFFGTFAWSAAALFTQLAVQLGGKLSRSSMLAAVRQVHNFTNGKMVSPQDVAGKHTPRCLSVIQLVNGKWVRKTPYPYTCGSVVNSGVS